jgi:hypothetical protein
MGQCQSDLLLALLLLRDAVKPLVGQTEAVSLFGDALLVSSDAALGNQFSRATEIALLVNGLVQIAIEVRHRSAIQMGKNFVTGIISFNRDQISMTCDQG